MKISGIIYDLDDTLISRDEAFYSGFTKKFYEKFVDKNEFDFVVSTGVIHHTKQPKKALIKFQKG